jgi:hypothetical protein
MPTRQRRRKARPQAEAPTRGEVDIILMRRIIGFLGVWEQCGGACRRRKACTSPTCACFDVNSETIRAMLTEVVEWPRLDGPREDHVAEGPPGELFE